MAEFPALPLWTDAFLADTLHLSTEEAGAYLLMLFTAWRRPECDLPDDDKFLMKICRCDGRKWRHLRPVMEQFHIVENGTWRQVRLQKERKYVGDLSQKQRANAKVRWSKNKGLADAVAMPPQCQTDAPTPTPIPKEERKKKEPPAIAGAVVLFAPKPVASKPLLPDWVDPAAWAGFVEMRKRKRMPMTDRAQTLLLRKLSGLRDKGHNPTAVLDASTANTWTDIYEPKPTGDKNGNRLRKSTAHDTFLDAARSFIDDTIDAGEGADRAAAVEAGNKLLSA